MIKNGVLIQKKKVPGYNTSLWFVVSRSMLKSFDVVEDLVDHKIIADEGKRSVRAYMYAYEQASGGYRMLVFLNHTAKPGTIAHECKHTLNTIFKWHGQNLSLSNDEHECYMLDWLVDRAHFAIQKYKRSFKITQRSTGRRHKDPTGLTVNV